MRITTFGVNAQYLNDLNNIMQKYQDLENQLSTGRKLNDPSDDPVAFETDIQAQTSLTQVDQWTSNAKQATSSLQASDSTLGQLQGLLGNVRTLLVQAANGTNTSSNYGALLSTVKQQVLSVAQVANATNGQQYVFSGANGKQIPIDTSTGTLVWQAGATPAQQTSIGQGVHLDASVDGQALFALAPPNSGATPSLIDTLNQIQQHMQNASQDSGTALQTDIQSLQSDLANLDANLDNVSAVRSDVGGRLTRVNAVQSQLAQTSNFITKQKSDSEDADMAKVMTDLTTQQTVYQAALLSGQRLILPTLADVLKG